VSRVGITGAAGMIGRALSASLAADGHEVVAFRRGPEGDWDPAAGTVDQALVDSLDAVVNLAGAPIGAGRWTDARRAAIRDSRRLGTGLVARAIATARAAGAGPAVLVSMSGMNRYGDRGDDILTEASPPGTGFLADVTREWEAATEPAADAGARVAIARSGVVLHPSGGFLKTQLLPYRLGLGGPAGRGDQWLPWISLDDEVAALRRLLDDGEISGAVNVTSPNPVPQREFARALGRVLRRPAVFPTPLPVLRVVLGREMVAELLTVSLRAEPARLLELGFAFAHPEIEAALRHLLGR
jgi:uncharacterized protein (TIGR01777 family)